MIQYPRLYNDNGGFRSVTPISLSLTLNITPLSTASMKLPKGESVPARAYVELFSPLGSAGIFRVRSPEDAYGDDITNVELEHAIAEVGDYLVKGNINGMIAANTAMQSVFSHYGGTRWQLGSVSALGSGKIAMQVQYERVLDAMLEILEQKPNCMMAFDFSTTPWTVSIVAKDTTVSAEGRLSRNVNAAKITYDDTELCTRVWYEQSATTDTITKYYPVFNASKVYSAGEYVRNNNKLYILTNGHKKGVSWTNTAKTAVTNIPTTIWTHKDADTINTYGVVERTLSVSLDYTVAEAAQVAEEYLAEYKHPQISIEISAEELSSITGETLDAFTVGKLMRLALPDYNTTVEQTITGIDWDSVYDSPNDMTVQLAHEESALVSFIHDMDAKGGGGGGGGAKKKEEDKWKEYRTKMYEDDFHFDLIAQRFNQAEDILQQAGLYIDSNGVLIYADDLENGLGSKFKVLSNSITLKVSKGNVATQLAVEVGNVSITGGNLTVDGYVKTSALNTVDAKIDNLMSGSTTATLLKANQGNIPNMTIGNQLSFKNHGVYWQSGEIGGITYHFLGYVG